jgi:hypothetical protein
MPFRLKDLLSKALPGPKHFRITFDQDALPFLVRRGYPCGWVVLQLSAGMKGVCYNRMDQPSNPNINIMKACSETGANRRQKGDHPGAQKFLRNVTAFPTLLNEPRCTVT